MPIVHRFIEELNNLEQNQIFCNQKIKTQSNILVIGTFNPDNDSCEKANNASWFYGRSQSKFWRYFPQALTVETLHPIDGHVGYPETWKKYCAENSIVIIDLINRIQINDRLPDFGDDKVECKINFDLSNTEYFNIDMAFSNIKFRKIIFSLAWTDRKLQRLRRIRDIVEERLLINNCIQNRDQIKYCKTPSRNDSFNSWNAAIND